VDIPSDDPNVKKLLKLIRGLETEDRRRALKLIKTTFGER